MSDFTSSIMNIALVGGGKFCRELLEKTSFHDQQEGINASIVAVVDPDFKSPGIIAAKDSGLLTFNNYNQLYEPEYHINIIIILTPDPDIFNDILKKAQTINCVLSDR